MPIVTQLELEEASLDCKTLEEVINENSSFGVGGVGIATSRLGRQIKTLDRVMLDLSLQVFDLPQIQSFLTRENLFKNPRWMLGLVNMGFSHSIDLMYREIMPDAQAVFGYDGNFLRFSGVGLDNAWLIPNFDHIRFDPQYRLGGFGFLTIEMEMRSETVQTVNVNMLRWIDSDGTTVPCPDGGNTVNLTPTPQKVVFDFFTLPVDDTRGVLIFFDPVIGTLDFPIDIGRINIYGQSSVDTIEFLTDKIRYENKLALASLVPPMDIIEDFEVTGMLTVANLHVLGTASGIPFEHVEDDPRDNVALEDALTHLDASDTTSGVFDPDRIP